MKIEKEGHRLYLIGDTYPIKSRLKRVGCKWDSVKRAWWCDIEKKAELERLITRIAKAAEKERAEAAKGRQASAEKEALSRAEKDKAERAWLANAKELEGNGYQMKDRLNAKGARYISARRCWYAPADIAAECQEMIDQHHAAAEAAEVAEAARQARALIAKKITTLSAHREDTSTAALPCRTEGMTLRLEKARGYSGIKSGTSWVAGLSWDADWAPDHHGMPWDRDFLDADDTIWPEGNKGHQKKSTWIETYDLAEGTVYEVQQYRESTRCLCVVREGAIVPISWAGAISLMEGA